jgi:hypothetical protein
VFNRKPLRKKVVGVFVRFRAPLHVRPNIKARKMKEIDTKDLHLLLSTMQWCKGHSSKTLSRYELLSSTFEKHYRKSSGWKFQFFHTFCTAAL